MEIESPDSTIIFITCDKSQDGMFPATVGDKFAYTTYNFPTGVGHFLSFARKFCPIR
jgi:hypothetical protein